MKSSSSLALLLLCAFSLLHFGESACGSTSIRIVNGPAGSTFGREGRVEFCWQNQWGTVCDDLWGNQDAKVVCRQVGYSTDGAVGFRNAQYGQGTGRIWLDNVRCVGTETNINGCPKNAVGTHNCGHHEDAGVRCPPCVDGSVYLVRSGSSRNGVVFLCNGGTYGTVCDSNWDLVDAQVVCKQLGYPTQGAQNLSVFSSGYNEAWGPVWATNLACTGSESRFTNCAGTFFSDSITCSHSHDAVVTCPACTQWDMQLYSTYEATPASEGLLQICNAQGQWRTICNHGFWCNDAKVACRQLGYNASVHTTIFKNADGVYGFFKYNRVYQYACTGPELSFSECPQTYDASCNNPQQKSVGLRCEQVSSGDNCQDGAARLRAGSDNTEGRLEYCYQGQWSAFCWLQDETATVACKELGFTKYPYASLFNDGRFGSSGIISDFKQLTCSRTGDESTLAECQTIQSTQCQVQTCPVEWAIKCFEPMGCDEGTFRLVDGDIEQEGRVEVCFNGVWGTICDSGWGAIDSYVVCRQLGYNGGVAPTAQLNTYYGDGVYPIVWGAVRCRGWEASLSDCPRNDYLNFYCLRTDIAGVLCAEDCQDGDVRLVGGDGDGDEGTVEVCFANLWGVIGQVGWGLPDAQVVCRQLGFTTTGTVPKYDSYYGRPNKTVHLINVNCDGTEDTINECTKTIITLSEGKTLYRNDSVAGVDCQPEAPTQPSCITLSTPPVTTPAPCIEGSVRLQGGDSSSGRLEYCYNGQYTSFCIVDEKAATVACKNLNFNAYTGASVLNGAFGDLTNVSLVKNISCAGSESQLRQCTINTVDDSCYPYCPGGNIGIRCYNSFGCIDGAIRLADGIIENEGRVEICYDGVWGSICDDGWDQTDAHIVCTQLGQPDLAPVAFYGSHFGDGTFPIVYSNMACVGSETTLASCSKSSYLQFSCPRTKVAGVLCGYDCNDGDVRLVGGTKATEGTVEVCYGNLWGQITDASWDDKDAQVICSLLGYSSDGAVASVGSKYGKTNRTIMLSDMDCEGDEMAIDMCTYTFHSLTEGKTLLGIPTINVAGATCLPLNCISPSTDVGSACTEGTFRTTGGPSGNDGNLQYCLNGYWNPFCTLNPLEATVACRSLGYTSNDWAAIYDDSRYNPVSNMSNFQYFNCSSNPNATSLSNCAFEGTCASTCANPLAIRCQPGSGDSCTEGDVRLVDGSLNQEGRVEVCINNVWGAICDSGWDKSDALVVCKQLGNGVAEPFVYYGSTFGDGIGPIVYSNMMCAGWESSLANCMKSQYPWSMCSRRNVAGVACRDGCTEGMVKLVGGADETAGTVLLCQDSFWSMIGDNSWDVSEATVVCTQLGFSSQGAVALIGSQYGKVNKTLIVNEVQCGGAELNISSCPMSIYNYTQGRVYAQTIPAAGVSCQRIPPTVPPTVCSYVPPSPSGPPCTDGTLQFQGSSGDRGILTYCYNQQWTPFCSIDSKTAQVACRQLGFTQFTYGSIYVKGELGSAVMNYSSITNISCLGSESRLSDCFIDNSGCVPTCNNNVGLRCYRSTGCQQGQVRLMDGVIQQQGRVEVCVDGVWSGICDDGWDKTNAYIVCQQLGFASTDSTAFPDSVFGNGDGPLIYSNVACVGHESTITDCSKSMFPDFTCTKGNSAGVMCADGCTDGMVRLVNGVTARDGTVEVCFDNLWGLVGTTGWTNLDALVVCNQVGLGDTQNPTPIIDAPKPQKTIHLNNVYCNGAEKGLAECRYHKLPITDPSSYPVAGVNCPPPNITTSSSSSVIIQATQLPHTENALFLITGVFGVFVVVGIVGVLSLLVLLVIIYQKRKGTEDILKRQADGVKDNMSLYAVVNKNRDSVSYSGGAIGLPENL